MNIVKYATAEITLGAGVASAENTQITLPEGNVTHFGIVDNGATEGKIINLELHQNNSRVLEPSDIRFSQKTVNGNFFDSLRPLSGVDGGRKITARLTAIDSTRTNDVIVQIMFVIQTEEIY